jgi:hypothetical protein
MQASLIPALIIYERNIMHPVDEMDEDLDEKTARF